jgi:hypothetical protein
MKAIKIFKLMGSALIVVTSINAWSQTSDIAALVLCPLSAAGAISDPANEHAACRNSQGAG